MRSSKEIRDHIAEILAKARALHELAESEQRDFTDEEESEFDGYLEQVGHDGEDGEPATGLYAAFAKAEKYEGILDKNHRAAKRLKVQMSAPGTVPAKPKRYSSGVLKAFKGDNAGEDAYRMGRWFAATCLKHEASQEWCRDHGVPITQAAMGETDNAAGGFTVPTELENTIITLREQYGVFRRWADVVPMASETKLHPKYVSGLTAYAVGEHGSITASDVALERIELIARKWGAIGRYSTELSEDSFVNWADRLASEMAYAFAKKEDDSGFIGDGTNTYHGVVGIMNKATSGVHVYTAATGNTSFGELDLSDFENALGQLPQYAVEQPGAAWFISRVGYYASMANLMNAAGGNNSDDLGAGPGMNFLGLPVVISQSLNATTTAQTDTNLFCVGNLMLGSVLGDRRGLAISTSEAVYFATDEVAIKGTTRFALNNHGLDAAAVGPIIIVRTPSS